MPRRAATVTQADVARAIRAARQAGLPIRRVLITPEGASLEVGEVPDIHSDPAPDMKLEPLEVI